MRAFNYCTKHIVELTWQKSKSKFNEDGTPKSYMGHLDPDHKMCFGDTYREDSLDEITPVVEQRSKEIREILKETIKHDSMLMCNAMNNACALASNGIITKSEISTYFRRILALLENPDEDSTSSSDA